MTTDLKVPVLPESVQDATIATWHKQPGDPVSRDENIVDIETDKVVLEVVAPHEGVMGEIIKNEGDTVTAQEVIGKLEAGEASAKSSTDENESDSEKGDSEKETKDSSSDNKSDSESNSDNGKKTGVASPSARRAAEELNVDLAKVSGTGKDGRITKEDVKNASSNSNYGESVDVASVGERAEKRVPMTRLRQRIAERLLSAQQDAAILTTFNEINMQPVMDLRAKYKEKFEKLHGVRLGFMSFFTRAVVEALKNYPEVNASIDGTDIVYHGFVDIGIAVSSPRGLVVPILRNTENMNMAEIERQIRAFGQKAKDGKLTIEEMTGGTFTISNGGVFGSLLSTPILNPPQSGILGMHKIEERAVVENGEIVIRPMMYVALSYDHRIIDGSQSVGFLVAIKEALEDPARLILEV